MLLNRSIAWICFVLSQGTIAISYLVALQYEHAKVVSCNPFFQGCLNITDAGIYSPEGFIFRGGMIAACAFFIMWWMISHEHIHKLLTRSSKVSLASSALGGIGAVLLIIATAVLVPPRDDINWTVHVAGATLFFLVSFAAQALHIFRLYKDDLKPHFSKKSLTAKLAIVIIQAIMIVTALTIDYLDVWDALKNAIEWWLALLIALYFLTGIWDWKSTDKT